MLRHALPKFLWNPWSWFVVLVIFAGAGYLRLDHPKAHTASPYAHGDGVYYYAYLRSLYFDQDVDFENDYALLGNPFRRKHNAQTGKRENVFTVGPAVFWMPLAPVAHAVVVSGNALGWLDEPANGTGPVFQRTVFFGSVVAGLLALAVVLWASLGFASPLAAWLAVIGVGFASPLIWYMQRQPSYSHAVDAFAVALLVGVWLRGFASRTTFGWGVMGACLGLAMLVRPQNAVNVLLPLAEWCVVTLSALRAGEGRALRSMLVKGATFSLMAAVVVAPLFIAWHSNFGEWFSVPQGDSFMLWTDSRWDAVLYASRNGLFAWHPLLFLGVMGLIGLALDGGRTAKWRWLGALGLAVVVLQVYVNGATRDWWGGWAFGGRRFVGSSAYFGVGLAWVMQWGRELVEHVFGWLPRHTVVERSSPWVSRVLGCLFVAAFVHVNGSLMDDYLSGRAKPDASQSMKPLIQKAIGQWSGRVYAVVGNPGSWPANLWFAHRAGVSPERYDAAGATDLKPGTRKARVKFVTDAHAMAGFSEPRVVAGRRARVTAGAKASWVVVLRRPSQASGTIALASVMGPSNLRMGVEGLWFFDQRIEGGWRDYPLVLPRAASRTGIVYVDVELAPAVSHGSWKGVAWDQAVIDVTRDPGSVR